MRPGNRRDVRTQAPHGLPNLCFWKVIEPDRAIVFHKAGVRWSQWLITIDQNSPEPTARRFPFPNAKVDTAAGVQMESFNSGGVDVAVDVEGWKSMAESVEFFELSALSSRMIESSLICGSLLCYYNLAFYCFPITD